MEQPLDNGVKRVYFVHITLLKDFDLHKALQITQFYEPLQVCDWENKLSDLNQRAASQAKSQQHASLNFIRSATGGIKSM